MEETFHLLKATERRYLIMELSVLLADQYKKAGALFLSNQLGEAEVGYLNKPGLLSS
jgi:hypothetical protein